LCRLVFSFSEALYERSSLYCVCAHGSGPHSELVKDPEGAYSQLIRLQEMRKESEKGEGDRQMSRQSSQLQLSLRSLSHESSGMGHHSFKMVFGVPMDHPEGAVQEPDVEALPSSQGLAEVSIRRLASLNKPEIPVLLLGVLSAIANGVIFPIFAILFSSAIEMFFKPAHQLRKDSRFWALMFLVLGLASFVTNPARTYFFSVAGCKLIQRIRSMCFEKVVNMEVSWFDEPEHSSGAIGARLSADAASVRALVGDALGLLVQNLATAIGGLLIAFVANWQLSLIILLLIPFMGLNGYLQMKFIKGFSADAKVSSFSHIHLLDICQAKALKFCAAL